MQYILTTTFNWQFKEMAQKKKISHWHTLLFFYIFCTSPGDESTSYHVNRPVRR